MGKIMINGESYPSYVVKTGVDDTGIFEDKAWSSKKTSDEIAEVETALPNIKKFASPSGTAKYITISGATLGDIEVHSAYAGKYMFTSTGTKPIFFGTSTYLGYTLTGWAWSSDKTKLYLRVNGQRDFVISAFGSDGVEISDMTTTAPTDVTFNTTFNYNAYIDNSTSENTSTYSSAKIDEKYDDKLFGYTSGDYALEIQLDDRKIDIEIVDNCGGKIELLGNGAIDNSVNYRFIKVLRLSHGNWTEFDATKPNDTYTKIKEVYVDTTNKKVYVHLKGNANYIVKGAKSVISKNYTDVDTSTMTLIPESTFVSKDDLAAQTANRQVKTFDNTGSSTEKWYKICSALTTGIGCNIKLTASRADSTATVQYFSALFRDSRYRYTSSYISRERTVYESALIAEYSAYIIADANNDIWVHVPSYGKAIIEIDTRAITIEGTVGTPVEDYVYSSFEHQYDGRIDDTSTNTDSTWSSSKIASEIGAKVTKTQYRGSRSIDISTGGKLTLIYSSEYASQAGCYMLLSNFNTEPLLIELGRNNIGQFSVTATHKSQNVDTITVTVAGDEYSWCVLQF